MCSPQQLRHTNSVFLLAGGGAAVEGVRGQAARVWHFEQHIVSLRRVRQHAWAANGGAGTVVSRRWSTASSRLHRARVAACSSPPADLYWCGACSRLLSTQAGRLASLSYAQICFEASPCSCLALLVAQHACAAGFAHVLRDEHVTSIPYACQHNIVIVWCLPCRWPSLWAC